MERNRTGRKRNQRCCNHNNVAESEYDVVDDQEEVLHVRILPARPIHDEREYADRDLPRSSSSQSLSSVSTGTANIPPRQTTHNTGPAINRDLKPGRKKTRFEKRPAPLPPADQLSHRHSPSPPPFISELVNHLPGLTLHEPCRRNGQKATRKAEFSSQTRGLHSAESDPSLHTHYRHSLDLESQVIDTRSQQDFERVPSKRHHHEWPQTKEDFDQHDFVPKEKPQQFCPGHYLSRCIAPGMEEVLKSSCVSSKGQRPLVWGLLVLRPYGELLSTSSMPGAMHFTYCEDWYVGDCTRADAEHALHLVNKDGAFLIRDCSVNTNSEPLVLVVYHEKKVYNVKIRFIESTGKYALGTGQRSNDMFDSVAEIIKFHSIFPIILISGRNMPSSKYPENCVLTFPVTRRDVDQLLQ